MAFWAGAQNSSENKIHSIDGRVYFEILVNQAEVEEFISNSEFCEEGTALSFCFRNYVNKKLQLAVNNSGEALEFTIEASLSNTKEIQINLSAETGFKKITSYQITNNLFVDEIPSFINKISVKLDDEKSEISLDSENRTTEIK